MKFTHLLALAAACFLSACANTTHLTDGLRQANATDRFVVEKPLTYVDLRGIGGVRWEEGLLPCVFKPTKSNGAGTFYEGEGKCVTQKMMDSTMGSPFRGGIWIPTDSSQPTRLYFYFDYDMDAAFKGAGPIVAALLEAGKGDLTFMPNIKDADFVKALNQTRQPGLSAANTAP